MNNSTEYYNNYDFYDYPEFIELEIALGLDIYAAPVLIFVGTILNIFSIIVLSKKSLRNNTTMFYLLVLSITDLLVLYIGLFRYWLINAFNFDIRIYGSWICKIHAFLVYFSLDFSSWILVAMTVDRCISIMMPLRAKVCCSVSKSRIVVAFIFLIMALLNSHLFYTVDMRRAGTQDAMCTCADGMFYFIGRIWPWIDLTVFCFLPIGIMLVANFFIIQALTLSSIKNPFRKKDRLKRRSPEKENVESLSISDKTDCGTHTNITNERDNGIQINASNGHDGGVSKHTPNRENCVDTSTIEEKPECIQTNTSAYLDYRYGTDNGIHVSTISGKENDIGCTAPSGKGNGIREEIQDDSGGLKNNSDGRLTQKQTLKKTKGFGMTHTNKHVTNSSSTNITKMLMFVNVAFILCTAPIGILFIYLHFVEIVSAEMFARISLAHNTTNMLQYVNNSIHFLLYCISGKRVREEFFALFRRK